MQLLHSRRMQQGSPCGWRGLERQAQAGAQIKRAAARLALIKAQI